DFVLVDTGGWVPPGGAGPPGGGPALAAQRSAPAAAARDEARPIVVVGGGDTRGSEEDARGGRPLAQNSTPALILADKDRDERREADVWEFSRLGLGTPVAISAIHGRLAGELLDEIVDRLPPAPDEPEPESDDADNIFSIAIVGRP